MATDNTGWFADIDVEQRPPYIWQPCLETPIASLSFQIWFTSKEACEKYIEEDILPHADKMTFS